MRKKLIKSTYLRDVAKYEINCYDEGECFVSCKKIEKVNVSFVVFGGTTLIDDGYKIIEIVPKFENYVIRIFVDKNNRVVQQYIDITKQNGFDEKENSPFYDDLYLDIIITNGKIKIDDENELNGAFESGLISIGDFELALKTKEKLLSEIKNKTNKFLNMDISKFLD